MRPNGAAIRYDIIRAVLVGATVAHTLEVEDFRGGTSSASLIKTKVSLVYLFRKHFRFLMGVDLVTVIIVVKVVDNLLGVLK